MGIFATKLSFVAQVELWI